MDTGPFCFFRTTYRERHLLPAATAVIALP
jgi:hypothetical protein